ncbi:non-functional pseudokinase ZED1-like [Olea europaea subsp. europaea]|uniref:Non-functional pseudokinase ZED1-like n=1 Tax=Olea europaea subsp. europaea TaxID=158383 RepID=A0A8S0SKX4_OLEEU|nr:non-functional pseudokinase ZED1-like [Olea europaea subsp. europaea]
MEWVKRKIRFLQGTNEKLSNDTLSPCYIENGGKLLEGLIANSNVKYDIPYRVFTIEELNKATNIDFPSLRYEDSRSVMRDGLGYYISGVFQQRSILVKKFNPFEEASHAVNNIVFTVLMNRHKNVLKVLGCCLDLELPAIIYEIGMNYGLLYDLVVKRKDGNNIGKSLSWSNRLKIATEVANGLVYLHTAFPTPIIHRDLATKSIVIDNGVVKLVNFSLCVALPPGESQVEVELAGTRGYTEPEYFTSSIITEKSDVYMFGIILLELLTIRCHFYVKRENTTLDGYVKNHVDKNELSEILDPVILGEIGETEHQLQAFSTLALRCTLDRGADRPYIIDVAKELVRSLFIPLKGAADKPYRQDVMLLGKTLSRLLFCWVLMLTSNV